MTDNPSSQLPVIAVDIGGTTLTAARVSAAGEVLQEETIATEGAGGRDHVLERIAALVDSVRQGSAVRGVGLAAPGSIDPDRGLVVSAPNLPRWQELPLVEIMEQRLELHCFLANDASAAALGEWRFGRSQRVDSLVHLTLGTGIGGGLVLNRQLYTGELGNAGEIGHMVVDLNGPRCGCGRYGCLETLASASALVRQAPAGLETAEQVFAAAAQGNAGARRALDQALDALAAGVANLANIFSVQLLTIGGGMAQAGPALFEPLRERVISLALPPANQVRIEPARLRAGRAAILGMTALVLEQTS